MSFFDDMQKFSLIVLIVGAFTALLGIITIAMEAMSLDEFSSITICGGVGSVIFGLLILGYAFKVRSGAIGEKINMLGGFTMVLAIVTIVNGILTAIGSMLASGGDLLGSLGTVVIGVILGLILLFVAKKMMDGAATTIDKIIWFLLVIILVVMTILSLVGVFAVAFGDIVLILAGIGSLFEAIMYLFFLFIALSDDVKKAMGI